jgi:hypothetical protein
LLAKQSAFQYALGQLFNEQRHTVGAIDDLVDKIVRKCLAAGNLRHQHGPISPVQAIERKHSDLWLAGPWWLELGSERHNQQHLQT